MSLLDYITEMSQVNDEIFKLDRDEYEQMADLFNDLGADIDLITVDDISENSMVGLSDTERFKKGIAIQINRGVHTSLREMIDVGIESKDWYYEISDTVFGGLGETDACVFLLFLASTSPQNALKTNFNEASTVFEGFKKDLNGNEARLYEFANDDSKVTEFSHEEGSEYWDLNIVQAIHNYGDKGIGKIGSKLNNIKKTIRLFMNADGNLSRNETANLLADKFNPYATAQKNVVNFDDNVALQKFKVYNFSMNLLQPDQAISMNNKQWYFVTIDIWMVRAMYPYLDDYTQKTVMNKGGRYLYAQQKIMDFANEVGLMPHQVQASIWVAKMKKSDNTTDSFTKVIQDKRDELRQANRELSDIDNSLSTLIRNIAQYSSRS